MVTQKIFDALFDDELAEIQEQGALNTGEFNFLDEDIRREIGSRVIDQILYKLKASDAWDESSAADARVYLETLLRESLEQRE